MKGRRLSQTGERLSDRDWTRVLTARRRLIGFIRKASKIPGTTKTRASTLALYMHGEQPPIGD